jgi:putative ubiquitin-RnfH superfamily antitoxin RatB of RatAB toxin-antitoxin module
MNESDSIPVQLVCAWPDRAYRFRAHVPNGTTAGELVEQSRVAERFPELTQSLVLGVFGRRVEPSYVLKPGDRVELLRPLRNDPKETRRRRAAQAGRTGR